MSSLAAFFHMGGYAFYVWSAYGLALVVLTIHLVNTLQQGQRVRRELMRRLRHGRTTP